MPGVKSAYDLGAVDRCFGQVDRRPHDSSQIAQDDREAYDCERDPNCSTGIVAENEFADSEECAIDEAECGKPVDQCESERVSGERRRLRDACDALPAEVI